MHDLPGTALAVSGCRKGFGQDRAMLCRGTWCHPEQQDVTGSGRTGRDLDEVPAGRQKQRIIGPHFSPVRGIGRCRFRLLTAHRTPDPPDQTETVRANALQTCLMDVGCKKPVSGLGNDGRACKRAYRRPPSLGVSASGPTNKASLPGMCGKPRKFSAFANRV